MLSTPEHVKAVEQAIVDSGFLLTFDENAVDPRDSAAWEAGMGPRPWLWSTECMEAIAEAVLSVEEQRSWPVPQESASTARRGVLEQEAKK